MCFSPEADLVGGLAITAIGIDVLRHVDRRTGAFPLAALPVLFGAHQLVETFVWWGLQGHVAAGVGHFAMWVYLIFAFVVLPTYVPVAVLLTEPPGYRRSVIAGFVVLGVVVSAVLLAAMLRGPVAAELENFHIAYTTDLSAGVVIVFGYLVATCGSFLASSSRHLVWFGLVNAAAVVVIAILVVDGFASVWCAWAAIVSAVLALRLRVTSTSLWAQASVGA